MNDSVLVSIVIPVYKTDYKWLDLCIDSVLSQTYGNYECLITDDGNEPEYASKLERYQELDKRITVLHKKNGGLGNTRNFATERAKGEYVFYLDSDDYISPYTIENAVHVALEEKADMVVGALLHVDENEKLSFKKEEKNLIVVEKANQKKDYINHICGYKNENYKLSVGSTGPSACSKLVRREIVLKAPFCNDRYWDEDNIWNISAVHICKKLVIVDNLWYAYLIHPDSMVRGYKGSRKEEFQFRAKQEYNLIKRLWPECKEAYCTVIWEGMINFCRTDTFHPDNPLPENERFKEYKEAINFPEFKEAVTNIDFNFEKRAKYRIVKKCIAVLLKFKMIRCAFIILKVSLGKIKF